MNLDARIHPNPGVFCRPFGAQMVLLDFARGEYFGLSEVGAEVWKRIEGAPTLAEIVDHVVATFDVARDVARADVERFVNDLKLQGLIGES